jgi:hypothetical protein
LEVLHEISNELKESVSISQVSLNSKSRIVENSNGFEIKMCCAFESGTWDGIKPILQKHGLSLKVEDGAVIVYTP